jgi:hypothetical protein
VIFDFYIAISRRISFPKLYGFPNLVAQNETFRKQKPSEQSQFWLPKQRSVVDPDQDSWKAKRPPIQEKWGHSCFPELGSRSRASKEKKIFLNSIFFHFYAKKNMLFCTFWSTGSLRLKTFRRIQHAELNGLCHHPCFEKLVVEIL